MSVSPEIAGALIGGGVVGANLLIAELLRRSQRGEAYASMIFAKRLEVYEGLWNVVASGQKLASEATAAGLSAEDRHGMVSAAVLSVAAYTDANAFYLNEQLSVHCCTLFMGIEDVAEMAPDARRRWNDAYSRRLLATRQMIREAAGVDQTDRIFNAVHKPKIDSPVIRYFQAHLKRQRR